MKRVELVKLFDGKVSVRVDGYEVYLLPGKSECSLADMEKAIEAAISDVEIQVIETEKEEWE